MVHPSPKPLCCFFPMLWAVTLGWGLGLEGAEESPWVAPAGPLRKQPGWGGAGAPDAAIQSHRKVAPSAAERAEPSLSWGACHLGGGGAPTNAGNSRALQSEKSVGESGLSCILLLA